MELEIQVYHILESIRKRAKRDLILALDFYEISKKEYDILHKVDGYKANISLISPQGDRYESQSTCGFTFAKMDVVNGNNLYFVADDERLREWEEHFKTMCYFGEAGADSE